LIQIQPLILNLNHNQSQKNPNLPLKRDKCTIYIPSHNYFLLSVFTAAKHS
jgi:hypothetical protein